MATTVADLTDLASPPSLALMNTTVDDLTDLILQDILARLCPADLLRAALACPRWRRAAVRALPRVPPLRGYFLHPTGPRNHHPAAFRPLNDASSSAKSLSIDFPPHDTNSLSIQDVHLGLVLLLPLSLPRPPFPRILVVDPASRRQVELLPPHGQPPSSRFIGAAILARSHPSRLTTFDAVCFTVCDDSPRAWVASVDGNIANWRAVPRTEGVVLTFDPSSFERRCVHAAGKIYWHISHSSRVLELDPLTLHFSFMTVPDALGDGMFGVSEYRVGEMPDDGRLCLASISADESLQLWVRGGGHRWSDKGWYLEREYLLSRLFDAVPSLPKDNLERMRRISLSDMDFARTGKVFIATSYGRCRYLFHLETGKLERSPLNGHPVFAYTLPWPPEFLAPPPPAN